MNTFFCKTYRCFDFIGRINEDVNVYTYSGRPRLLYFTIYGIDIVPKQTQAGSGDMTEVYLDKGTYVNSFFPILLSPSYMRISTLGTKHESINHKVLRNYCVPNIIREEFKKV